LGLANNQLPTFDGTDLSSLTDLNLNNNPLTSFIGGDMGLIIELNFQGWNITTLESFDGGNMAGLTQLSLNNNQLTSINISGLTVLQYLLTQGNPSINTPSINNSLLAQLAANELANDWNYGEFYTTGGRTSAGTADYDYLISEGWYIEGADLVVVSGSKLRIKGAFTINGNVQI
jgi:hypothetical protein